jgi:hypothetical protein
VRSTTLAAVLLGLVLVTDARAQTLVPLESFRVEWARRTEPWMKPGVEGYVYNDSVYRVSNVRLRIEVLDGANQRVGERFGWVYGSIDPGGRGYFVLPPPEAGHTYLITVVSFDPISRQAP